MKISTDKTTCVIVQRENKYGGKDSYIVDPFRMDDNFQEDMNSRDYLYKLVYDCETILTDSRYKLISPQMDHTEDNPFFVLLQRLDCVFTYRIDTMATNDEHIFINPTFWCDLYKNSKKWKELQGWSTKKEGDGEVNVNHTKGLCCNLYVFIHELMHCMLDHIREHRFLIDKYPDQYKANIAMDYVCNHYIEEMFPLLRGVGNFIKAYYDTNRGIGHWTDEYEIENSKPNNPNNSKEPEWSDDKKKGFEDTINEIRSIVGSVSDALSDRSSAYHKIVKMYGPVLKKLKGVNINDILNESVVDNITKISDDYDEGVIEVIKAALKDLETPTVSGGFGGDSDNNKPNGNIVDRDIDSGQDSDDSDDSDNSNSKNGKGGGKASKNSGAKKASWDIADEIAKEICDDKIMDDVNGKDTKPGESDLLKKLQKMKDSQEMHNVRKLPPGGNIPQKVTSLIKSLGDNDWTGYLSRFISDYLYKRVNGRLKTEYEVLDGTVIPKKQRERIDLLRHLTIIMDTSGSVMGNRGAYDYFVSEIGKVLESVKGKYDILVDFITFGSGTHFTRFLHRPGTFLSDTKNNKSFSFGDNGTTDYHDSFKMAHLLMTDKSKWSSFSDSTFVTNITNRIDEENAENNIDSDIEYGPSACTVCFTDSDFCWGNKYRGDGFGPACIREFKDKLCVFMVVDGGPKDAQCINPTDSNGVLKYRNPEDSKFGWNIHFVSSDCIRKRVNEGIQDFEDDDSSDMFNKEDMDVIRNMYGDLKTSNVEYFGNNILSSLMSAVDDVYCNDMSDNMLLLKSLKPDRKIESSIFPRIASITGDLNYALDGYMYIQGNLIGASASESEVDSNIELILSKLPTRVMPNSAIIFDQCHDMTTKLYGAIKERCGENNVAFMNCKRLCAAINDFSDHPITTIDYILEYWKEISEMDDDLSKSIELRLYAVNKEDRPYSVIYSDSDGMDNNDLLSKFWFDKVGVFLCDTVGLDIPIEINGDRVTKNSDNSKYGFAYIGFPPYIKFVGTDGRIVISYRQKQGEGWRTDKSLKGSMCMYNRIVPISPNQLKEENGDVGTERGIYLINCMTNNMAYIFVR